MDHFVVRTTDAATGARRGTLKTLHGEVQTPVFMPVGTQASVKALTPVQVRETGAQIILGNTYHLNLRPGSELIARFGGLHRFMDWDGPILTDSGGFQVFSLAQMRKITPEGIRFRSHIDGAEVFLGPREVMTIQANLGSDIAMVLDECPPWPPERAGVQRAVERSLQWAGQCLHAARESGFIERGHHVFGIVQGSTYEDLRRTCARELAALPFSGYAIGGVSVGEPEEAMMQAVTATTPHLPAHLPRYVMGVGTPPQLLRMIAMGVDMFDCVMPTREARHGVFYTYDGRRNIKNARFREDAAPLCEGLDSYANRFSRAYVRHLFMAGEMLASTLLTYHNVSFFVRLLDEARRQIEAGTYADWHQQWIARYEAGGSNAAVD